MASEQPTQEKPVLPQEQVAYAPPSHPPSAEGSQNDVADEKLAYQASDRDVESNNNNTQHVALYDGEPSKFGTMVKNIWHHPARRVFVDMGLIGLILGWWIPGIVREETRHKWVITVSI